MTISHQKLTYSQIAKKYDTTIGEVNHTINIAYNKIVNTLVEDGHDIWEVVCSVKDYFGMTESECVDKLNNNNKLLLREAAKRRFE